MKSALAVCLVAGLGLTTSAQSFYNLDFEQATLVPVPGDPYGRVWFPLLGWAGYCGTNAQDCVNYNAEFLDSAGISILDSQCVWESVAGVKHGHYCVCLYSGFQFGYEFDVETWIAQTGWIPAGVSNILFNFSPSQNWGDTSVSVTFNGISIPLSVVSGGGTNSTVLSGDLSQFANQVGELRFTAPIEHAPYCGCGHWRSIFLLDNIRFSPPPPTIVSSPQSQTANVGACVDFTVTADGAAPISYQWFFNGNHALGSATTNSFLRLTNIQPTQSGAYSVVVSNAFGAVNSSPAMLSVIPPVPRRTVPAISLTGDVGTCLHLCSADTSCPGAAWQELDAVTLTATRQWFVDLTDPSPSHRFYCAWQTNVPGVRPLLQMSLAAQLTLTGAIGDDVCIYYINQFGPTNAWVGLSVLTLTNSPQLYFDFGILGRPARLYRVVAMED